MPLLPDRRPIPVFLQTIELPIENDLRCLGSKERSTGANGFDCYNQISRCIRFQDKSTCAGINHAAKDALGIVDRHDQKLSARTASQNLAHRFDSVEDGHANVHNGDVGVSGEDSVYSSVPIRCLAHDTPPRVSLKQATETVTHDFVIVCQKETKRCHVVLTPTAIAAVNGAQQTLCAGEPAPGLPERIARMSPFGNQGFTGYELGFLLCFALRRDWKK
jgi:hypothetical protein